MDILAIRLQAPIRSLTDDVLLEIFMQCKPFRSNDNIPLHITAWLAIPRVCRRWRALCLSSALYWTHVIMPNPTYLKTILERACQAPLVLKIDTEVDDVDCIALLEGHIYHTRYLNIASTTDSHPSLRAFEHIKRMLQQPMPQMRGLHLRFHSVGGRPFIQTLPDDLLPSLPALRLIDIRGIRIDWIANKGVFGHLTSLHLEHFQFPDLREVLANMPSLREVAVVICDPLPDTWLPPPKSLIWPKLESLEFLCSPRSARIFCDAIAAPDAVRLTWRVREPPIQDPETIPQHEALLREVLCTFILKCSHSAMNARRLPALTLTTQRNTVSFDWFEDIRIHDLPKRGQDPPAPCVVSIVFTLPFHLSSALRTMPLDGVQSLCVDERVPWRAYSDSLPILPSLLLLPFLRDLRVLVLRAQQKDSSILKVMAANDGADTPDELLLPQLKHLVIEHMDLLMACGDDLLDYVKRRARTHQWLTTLTIRMCIMSSHKVAELDTYVRQPVSWDYISMANVRRVV
ncbi:hypothetical protein PENSPDRAFT_648417 [Peniophora sp. CONT]|nr:hypothetical protein PENSPDRAFT_648417 [Peniophora sp. CONT]